MYLSLRTRERTGHAGRTIARIVGREGKAGGHGMMAGGIAQIDKFEPPMYDAAFAQLVLRFLDVADASDREAEPLLDGVQLPELEAARAEAEADAPVS
jgi:hypothetical protein